MLGAVGEQRVAVVWFYLCKQEQNPVSMAIVCMLSVFSTRIVCVYRSFIEKHGAHNAQSTKKVHIMKLVGKNKKNKPIAE